MIKINLNLGFSIKDAFSWRSAPRRILSINHRPGLGLGPKHAIFMRWTIVIIVGTILYGRIGS